MAGIGSFPATWLVATDAVGAKQLTLEVVVETAPHQKISGRARLTQAVFPPLDLVFNEVAGTYTNTTGFGARHLVNLESESPNLNAPSLRVAMEMELDWKSGIATYYYSEEGPGHQHEVGPAPVRAEARSAAAAG